MSYSRALADRWPWLADETINALTQALLAVGARALEPARTLGARRARRAVPHGVEAGATRRVVLSVGWVRP